MEPNPNEAPREPGGQRRDEPMGAVPYPHWLTAIDVLVIIIVLATLSALFLPAVQ